MKFLKLFVSGQNKVHEPTMGTQHYIIYLFMLWFMHLFMHLCERKKNFITYIWNYKRQFLADLPFWH